MADLFVIEAKPSSTTDVALPDVRPRGQALDIRQSWVVEAPAGSGKTGLLIQRYLKLLADDSVEEPEQVLAITFTRKATAELLERVVGKLQAAAREEVDAYEEDDMFERETLLLAQAVLKRDRTLGWSLLDQPHRLKIRTIDSVCGEIAGALPLLSGGTGRRKPVDDAGRLYALAARRTFLELGGEDAALDAALRTVLLHRDGDLANCEQLLAGMLQRREQWGELIPLDRRTLDDAWMDEHVLLKLERALDRVICTSLNHLAKTIPPGMLQALTQAAAKMAHLEGHDGALSPIAICAGRYALPGEMAEDLEHWRALVHLLVTSPKSPGSKPGWRKSFLRNHVGFDTGSVEQDLLKRVVERLGGRDDLLAAVCAVRALPPARYPVEQWIVAKALFRTLKRALVELQLVFAEQGHCDYTELVLAARAALTSEDGSRDLESALGVHLQHLLVDEMQDTSSSQYELLHMLTQGWDGHSQTVFLVGDPKQSIYLFRQARVERFLRLMRSGELGELPLASLRLTANFRSSETLVENFNDDFLKVFPTQENAVHPEEVPYALVSAMRPSNRHSPGRSWHANALPKAESTKAGHRDKARRRAEDAREIRRIVTGWRSRPLPPGRTEPWTIAVLVRSRIHLEPIVAAFKDRRAGPPIPFRAVDVEALKDRAEVRDLSALTRALLHPADRVAWLSVLRAPWCGFTLANLHLLTGADDYGLAEHSVQRLLTERGDLLGAQACQRLERVWTALQAGLELSGRQPIAEVVERTWRSLGGDAYCDASELANARRYLELLDEMEEETGAIDLKALDGRLDHLYAAASGQIGAVDLLTIHKAKGLEWDVVIVPGLERRVNSNTPRLLNWLELDSSDEEMAHVLLAPVQGKGEASDALNTWIRNANSARETAEHKRLFYVACTRAREELHIFASPSLSKEGNLKPERGSLLEAAWPAAQGLFNASTVYVPARNVATMPARNEEESEGLALAAVSDGPTRPTGIQRLPSSFDPAARFVNPKPLNYGDSGDTATAPHFDRPEGSFAARAFGNAVHAFLEQIALRLVAREQAAEVLAGLAGSAPRIAAVLRAEGLRPAAVERLAQRVLFALENTLKDPQGLWTLSAHEGAATEFALTAWQQKRSTIRVDRMFRAGTEPMKPGSDCLWIVDYKTTTHGATHIDHFLEEEKSKYAPQLQAYAEVLAQDEAGPASIRLALYYPMLQRMIWWDPVQAQEQPQQLNLLW